MDRRLLIWSTLSVTFAGAASVALLYSGPRIAILIALTPVAVLLGALALPAALEHRALGLIMTWAGLIAPFVVIEDRSVGDLHQGLVTPLNVFQGVAPIVFFVMARLTCRKRILPLRGCEPALLAFGAVCLLSAVWSVEPLASAFRAAQLLTIYLLLILLVRQLGSSAAVVRHIVGGVYVGIACILLGLVIDARTAMPPETTYDFARNVEVAAPSRLGGLVPAIHYNLVALLAVVALLSLVAGVGPRWAQHRPTQVLICGGSLVALMLSGTRTALVLLALGLLILAALDAQSRSRVLALAIVALVALLVIPAVQGLILEYLRRGQDPHTLATLTGRTTTWGDALAVWGQRPLIGYGYYAGHRFLGFAAGRNLSNLDNMYIETLVDAGLVGLGALVVFLLTGVRRLVRSARGNARSFSIAVVLVALVGAAVNPSIQTPGVALIVVVGLLLPPWSRPAGGDSRLSASSSRRYATARSNPIARPA